MASSKKRAVAVVIAVNGEHDQGLRIRDLSEVRLSVMMSRFFLCVGGVAVTIAFSETESVDDWRFQVAELLARGLDSTVGSLLLH